MSSKEGPKKQILMCTICQIVLLIFLTTCSMADATWYQGCFLAGQTVGNYKQYVNASLPVCSQKCREKRVVYTAVRGSSCFCVKRLDGFIPVAPSLCNFRCRDTPDDNLPCGRHFHGQRLWSLYRSRGPFLEKVKWRVDASLVESGVPVTLEAHAFYHNFVDMQKEALLETAWQNRLEFVWRVGFTPVGVNASANSSQEYAICSLTFPSPGDFTIELTVKNLVSTLSVSFPINVVPPKPRLLQVTQLDDPSMLPSCVPPISRLQQIISNELGFRRILTSDPSTADDGGWPNWSTHFRSNIQFNGSKGELPLVLATFVNHTTNLEIAVASGVNLTFDLRVWNTGTWEERSQWMNAKECRFYKQCKHTIQEYIFNSVRVYPMQIKVHNKYGDVRKNIIMVTLDQSIQNMTVRLERPDSSVVRIDDHLFFHLSSITTLRQSTHLTVDFGDGVVKTALVRERQNVSSNDRHDPPTLFASYGEGCNLSLQFDHYYHKEGVFQPLITLSNDLYNQSIVMETPVTVINVITSPTIESDSFGIPGHGKVFRLGFRSFSVNMTAVWKVKDDKGNAVHQEVTRRSESQISDLSAVFHFQRPGRYIVHCQVFNLISSVEATTHIIILDPVAGLKLACDKGQAVELKEYITCTASCELGTNPSFLWDLQEKHFTFVGIRKNGSSLSSSSVLTHTFVQPGTYNISVTVFNNVSSEKRHLPYKLIVEIAVGCLNVFSSSPTAPNRIFNIIATATQGTNVIFDLDIDQSGRIKVPQEVEVHGNTTIFSIGRSFSFSGLHNITVWAYNHVSKTSRLVDVHIQDLPPPFSIRVMRAPLATFRSLVLETHSGALLHRPDLIFQFTFSDGHVNVTQVPIITRSYQSNFGNESQQLQVNGYRPPLLGSLSGAQAVGSLTVDVKVFNDAGYVRNSTKVDFLERSDRLTVSRSDNKMEARRRKKKRGRKERKRKRRRRRPVLWHPMFVRPGNVTYFLLTNISKNMTYIEVNYGDDVTEQITCFGSSCNWDRRFTSPGLYKLALSFYGKWGNPAASPHFRSKLLLQSVVVVEEPIKGLRVAGPALVETDCNHEWSVHADSGSHLVFIWSLDGKANEPTTIRKYVEEFAQPGTHILHVKAFNDISSAEATLKIQVKSPIQDLELKIFSTVLGQVTYITMLIQGEPPFSVHFDFGNGNKQLVAFESLSLTEVPVSKRRWSSPVRTLVPSYRSFIEHSYTAIGRYRVIVTVDNAVSSISCEHPALVEEPIRDIQLFTRSAPVLSIQDQLVITAVVGSGHDLAFDWNFPESSTEISQGRTSEASYSFSSAGKYQISVTVSNSLQPEGETVFLPYDIQVVEPISYVDIKHISGPNMPTGAAPLTHREGQREETPKIVFQARSTGSDVTFIFDFGDGTISTITGMKSRYSAYSLGSIAHVYTQIGAYKVSVTAINKLGSQYAELERPFYVQIPPMGLTMKATETYIHYGQIASFSAKLTGGTNVTINWKLDDETELIDAGSYIEHQYRQIGKEKIQVTAKNYVAQISAYDSIEVQEKITDVVLTTKSHILVVGEPASFYALILPPSAASGAWFEWESSPLNAVFKRENGNFSNTYRRAGRFYTKVTAANHISVSDPAVIEVHVVERLDRLSISVKGEVVVNSTLHLIAHHWSGSSPVLTWDFGDGSPIEVVNNSLSAKKHVSHIYKKPGEYQVSLKAENPISVKTAQRRIFVLNQPCREPEVEIVGSKTLVDNILTLEFTHSDPIHVEAELSINCSTTSEVKFKWFIIDPTTLRTIMLDKPSLEERKKYDVLTCPCLILHPGALKVGFYIIKLQVDMIGTSIRVYSEAQAQLHIIGTPLVASIFGGLYRQVGQNDTILIDGSDSHDVDDDDAELRFSWLCKPLDTFDEECFISEDHKPLLNMSSLLFPAYWLTSDFKKFVFNLTVWRHHDHSKIGLILKEMANTSQVIHMVENAHTIPISLECVQCRRHLVNSHHKVSLRTHIPNKWHGDLTYEWEISMVYEDEDLYGDINPSDTCTNADGSISFMKLATNHSTSPPSTLVTQKLNSSSEKVQKLKSRPTPVMLTEKEDETKQRQEHRLKERRREHMASEVDYFFDLSEDESTGSRRFDSFLIEEGKSGSGARNMGGAIPDPEEMPHRGREINNRGGDNLPDPDHRFPDRSCINRDDCLMPTATPSPLPPHLVSKLRIHLEVPWQQTLTGFNQSSLVLKPNILKQGRTYFIQVKATAKDGSQGSAISFFTVNRSPSKGRCTVHPQKGIAMHTFFKILCHDWQDEHKPIRYEVSYTVLGADDSAQSARIVYQGVRQKIRIQLPAGLPKHDYQVLLHVAILDKLQARTTICRLPIQVNASTVWTSGTDVSLKDQSISLLSLASTHVYNGSASDLINPLSQVAWRLNTNRLSVSPLHAYQATQAVRRSVRNNVLDALTFMPLRNQVEVVQVQRCLADVTDQIQELDDTIILKTKDLLKDITVQVHTLLQAQTKNMGQGLHPEILPLALRIVSSVLTALADGGRLFQNTRGQERLYSSVSRAVMNVLDQLLEYHLQSHSIGEAPLIVDSYFLSVNASHYTNPLHRHLLATQDVSFLLPSNLFPARGNDSGDLKGIVTQWDWCHSYDSNQHCIQSRAISYQANPFALGPRSKVQVQTAVASLDLYSCNGSKLLPVENLPESDSVHINIHRPQSQRPAELHHYLNKTAINIHTLKLSSFNEHHPRSVNGESFLHIHIQMEALEDALGFPIMVIISSWPVPENVHHFIFKEVYQPSREDIKIFLSSDAVSDGESYSVSLVEASFNSGRRRPEEIKGRFYNLSAWWDICVFWNVTKAAWTGEGCRAMPSSSLHTMQCSCNHLSTFGGFFEVVPHTLNFEDVEAFFSPHKNPIVVVMVSAVCLIYLAIVMMVRSYDEKNSQKKKIVYLQDNASSHHQKYEVVMETGFHAEAGTTSRISVILHGETGISETRELTCAEDSQTMFERNSRERFIITLPESLGKIFKIQLWHSNSGPSPGWFVRQVIVRDLSVGQVSYFLCQRWLAVDRGDGKVEREFLAVNNNCISFKQIFMCIGPQYLSDFHIWLSVLTCPPHSRFTRVQRLSLCLMMVMSYMGLSTMWYKSLPPPIRGEFGLLDLSWYNVVVGMTVCFIFLPVGLFIGFLFRRSRISVRSPRYPQGHDKSGYDYASQCDEETPQPAITYSILDQSILNWQHIQDWAHKQWLKRQQSVRSSANSVKTTQASPQLSVPSTTPLVQQTMLADDTDQGSGSSGFEDATSQATAERNRVKTTSDVSSDGHKSRNVEPQNSKKMVLLPFWWRYVSWALCFLITITGGGVTILYGWRFSHQRSVMWIQAVYFSIITCIFIAQPALILLSVIYTSFCRRGDLSVLDIVEETEDLDYEDPTLDNQSKKNSDLSPEEEELQQGVAARSRSRYLRFAGPPQEKQLKSSRKKILKEKKALYLFKQARFVLSFLMLVLLLAFGRDHRQEILLNKAANQAFVGGESVGTRFSNVQSLADWFAWYRHILVETLSAMHSVVGENTATTGSELGYLLGRSQIRQMRAELVPCDDMEGGGSLKRQCVSEFSETVMDEANDSSIPWIFKKDSRADLDPGFLGALTWYGHQGQVLLLNNTRSGLLDQLHQLESSSWFRHLTKAVFVEMTVFNPPTGLYCSITLLLELSPTGKAFPTIFIRSSPLFYYTTLWENILLGCELSLIMIMMMLLTDQGRKVFVMGKSYFLYFWNYIEMLTSLASLLYVTIFMYRFVVVMELVEFLRSTLYEHYLSFAFLTLLNEMLQSLLGIIIFGLVVKGVHLLGYIPSIARPQIVLAHARHEIAIVVALFGGLVMAFSSLGHILFGSIFYPMRSLLSSVMAFIALSTRILSAHDELHCSNQTSFLAITYVFAYVLIHGLSGVYLLSILTYWFKRVRIKRRMSMPLKKLVIFYWDHILTWTHKSQTYTQPQATDSSLPPEFTMAEILYLVEELLFRMNALMGTSGLPDKHNSFSDSDSNHNGGDDGISSAGSEDHQISMAIENANETPEDTRLEYRVQKIEDKLCSNEPYLAQLLKLDSIGTDILSEEKEQELRSQLEFEIFRQLQIQRQETSGPDTTAAITTSAITSTASPSAPLLTPASHVFMPIHKWNHGAAAIPFVSAQGMQGLRAKNALDVSGAENTHEKHLGLDLPSSDLTRAVIAKLKVPNKDTTEHLDPSQMMQKMRMDFCSSVDQDVTDMDLKSKFIKMDKIPVTNLKRDLSLERSPKKTQTHTQSKLNTTIKKGADRVKEKDQPLIPLLSYTSSGNASPQSSESERGHRRTDSSSGQSGQERQDTPRMVSRIGHERFDNPRGINRRGDLPPRPTFSHTMLAHSKSRQFEFRPDLAAAESSSGSEQEAGFGVKRTSAGKRNLRKTKSRGKGKGSEVEIDSPMVLSADFPLRGQGVATDCDIIIHPIPSGVDLDDISIPE